MNTDKKILVSLGTVILLIIVAALGMVLLDQDNSNSKTENKGDNDSEIQPVEPDREITPFSEARNAQRRLHVTEILEALTQYTSEDGNALKDFGNVPQCTDEEAIIGSDGIDLDALLVDEYIISIPLDPQEGSFANTGYTMCQTEVGRVQISAPFAEGDVIISVTL